MYINGHRGRQASRWTLVVLRCPNRAPRREWALSVTELFERAHDVFFCFYFLSWWEMCWFHPVSRQIELWHIVHNLRNWSHIRVPAVSCFWQLQILLCSLGGVVGHPWSPWCALMLQLWVLFIPSDTARKRTEAQTGYLIKDTQRVNGSSRIWTQINNGSTLKFLCHISSVPRLSHLNPKESLSIAVFQGFRYPKTSGYSPNFKMSQKWHETGYLLINTVLVLGKIFQGWSQSMYENHVWVIGGQNGGSHCFRFLPSQVPCIKSLHFI